jgi:Phage P22-like portal protein
VARKQSDEDILETARERFKLCEDAEQEIRKDALDDLRFVSGDQWDAWDRNSRTTNGSSRRPCLTFNKLIGPLNQTANEARMNTAGIEVNPVDSMADPDTADVIEGMIRHIEYVCKADEVYETALEQSTAGSFGYFRVVTRYCGAKSFDQELRIERVLDPFAIYLDPYAREADKSDMKFAFEIEWVPREDYKAEYGEDSIVSQMNFYDGLNNPLPDWITQSGVRIARYWTVETTKRTLQMIDWPDGTRSAQYKDEIPADLPAGLKIATGADGKPIERETEERQVKCYKINGIEVLDETDWPGQFIPLLPVLGKEMYVDGKRKLFSLVRFAKDPQKLYNFYRSSEAETVLLGTKAPWIGVKGMFRDPRWATANSVNWAYLEYEPQDIAGQPAQPPQRNVFEPPIQALSLGAAQASDDIKATTGIFDASLGSQGNETSGIAIRQRQSQAGMANAHFIDNLNRAIRQCGVILCDLIPRIYDTPREVRILGEDRAQQIVKVNQRYQDERGLDRCYDLQSGKYDVTITVGPSYSTQRQQTWDVLTQLAQSYPQLVQIAGDIMFANADFPGAAQIAERLKKTLPPGMADPPSTNQQQMQQLAAQAQQMSGVIDQLTQALNNAQETIRTKQIEHDANVRVEQMKIESSDRQAALKAQVDLVTTAAKLGSTEDIAMLQAQLLQAEKAIARMSSGAAAESAAPQAAPGAPAPPVAMPAPASL